MGTIVESGEGLNNKARQQEVVCCIKHIEHLIASQHAAQQGSWMQVHEVHECIEYKGVL